MQRIWVTLFAVMLLVPTGISSQAQADTETADLEPITLLMTFIPNIQFATMYAAIENGHFADAGFDVTLAYLNEPDVIDLVATGREQFGIVSGEQVILAASRGRPITFVYEWFQEYPVGVVVPADRDISSPEDLQGLRVGVPGRFGASYSGLTTLLQSADLSERDVDLQEIGFAAPDVFCVGAVQASTIYVNNEPLQIQNRAQQDDCGDVTAVEVIRVADYVDLVSNGLITNQDLIETDPDRVARFVAAFDAGLRDVLANPPAAYLLSAPYIENLPLTDALRQGLTAQAEAMAEAVAEGLPTDDLQSNMMTRFRELYLPDVILQLEVLMATNALLRAERLGYTDAESWDNMQDTLLTLGALDAPIDLAAIYTNRFVPDANEAAEAR